MAAAGPAISGDSVVWGAEYRDGSGAVKVDGRVVTRFADAKGKRRSRSFTGVPGAVSASPTRLVYTLVDSRVIHASGDSVGIESRFTPLVSIAGAPFANPLGCTTGDNITTAVDGDTVVLGVMGRAAVRGRLRRRPQGRHARRVPPGRASRGRTSPGSTRPAAAETASPWPTAGAAPCSRPTRRPDAVLVGLRHRRAGQHRRRSAVISSRSASRTRGRVCSPSGCGARRWRPPPGAWPTSPPTPTAGPTGSCSPT